MTTDTHTTRRAVLKAAPAVALTAAVPATAGEGESEIMRLFREWQAVRHEAVTADQTDFASQQAWEAHVEECFCARDSIEADMVAILPSTAAEVAAVVLATTQWGDEPLIGYGFGDQLVAKLMALVGVEPEPDWAWHLS